MKITVGKREVYRVTSPMMWEVNIIVLCITIAHETNFFLLCLLLLPMLHYTRYNWWLNKCKKKMCKFFFRTLSPDDWQNWIKIIKMKKKKELKINSVNILVMRIYIRLQKLVIASLLYSLYIHRSSFDFSFFKFPLVV